MGLLILGYALVFLGLPAIVGGALVGFLVALDRPGTTGQGIRGGIAGAVAGTILGVSALYYTVGAIWPGWVGAFVGSLLWSSYSTRKPG